MNSQPQLQTKSVRQDEISIERWLAEEIERLLRFRNYYNEGTKIEPDCYPKLLPTGEWYEQYRLYDE